MNSIESARAAHRHVFLGAGHEQNERRTWFVIWLCGLMMVAEIIGGLLFGTMSTLLFVPVVFSAVHGWLKRRETHTALGIGRVRKSMGEAT